jgi:hypothetical protein
MLQQPLTPLIIELTDPVTEGISVLDVLGGALGLAGWLILGAVVLALIFAGALIALRRSNLSRGPNAGESSGTSLDLHLPSH